MKYQVAAGNLKRKFEDVLKEPLPDEDPSTSEAQQTNNMQ